MTVSIKKSDAEWLDKLTPEQYHVCRQCGTEAPFTGLYWDCHDAGIYRCVCCGSAVFDSESKFDSGSGWPSFWQATNEYAVKLVPDNNPRKGDADGFPKGTLAVSARELADRSVSPMPAASPYRSHGMERIEARCAKCDAHLGHLFEDGPPPTKLRFCINSTSLALDRK